MLVKVLPVPFIYQVRQTPYTSGRALSEEKNE
jgi:hypothetical protein